ncbi:MAG: hypothetical protein E6J35_06590 [Chloroflexi bacterium]|nr:MAG: hypothetical protein E6J35_06590 [Chloroflexota bacterium]
MATKTDQGEAQREFLRERFGPAVEIAVMRPGEWSVAYSVRTADGDLVARFGAYDEDFEKDAFAARYSSQTLPVPPILEWGPALGGFYAVAPRVNGEHIDGLDEARMRRVLPSVFAALDAMRAVDLSAASGFGGWRADGRTSHRSWREWLLGFVNEPATRGAPGWRELLRDLPSTARSFEESYERLAQLADPCPEVRNLFHDDLINRNVLVDDDRVTAVLDWGSSKYRSRSGSSATRCGSPSTVSHTARFGSAGRRSSCARVARWRSPGASSRTAAGPSGTTRLRDGPRRASSPLPSRLPRRPTTSASSPRPRRPGAARSRLHRSRPRASGRDRRSARR